MEHQLYTGADLRGAPEGSYLYRMICEGGLGICKVCGLGEGSLTTECPGERSGENADDVYAGNIDYVDGHWRAGLLNPTNQMWARVAADRAENPA